MASGKHIPCGPCMFDDVTKDSWRWCTNCEEGLCEDCEKVHRKGKTTRNHKVITIEDYRKIEHVSISQVCEHHGENLEWLCKSHDEVLCVVCVPSKHKACSDIIPISVNSPNSRQSSALSDLEETIERTLRNVKQCIKNRESATKEIDKQELDVKTMILDTRTKINGQLDRLQEKLLQELGSASHTCKSNYIKILRKLKSTEELLTKLREQTIHMKQFSSDIKVFLGTRQVDKLIKNEIESLKSEINVTKDYGLKVDIHSLIDKLFREVEDFGQIKVTECNAINFDFRDPKVDQAQIEINIPTSRNISDIKLQLIKTFTISRESEMNITGCVILPNGHILVANYKPDNHLIEYSDSGKHIRDIHVSSMPYDIALIDPSRIVVTYGDGLYLEVINTITFNVENKIDLQKTCAGVSYDDGRLYVICGHGIQVLNLVGRQLETLQIAHKNVFYIKTTKDKMFFTENKNNKVVCCCLNGDELWQLKCDSIEYPKSVGADIYYNVYVVGYISNNLTVIQYDGKDSKTLLTQSDGLNNPTAMDMDNHTKTLIICNQEGNVSLYRIL